MKTTLIYSFLLSALLAAGCSKDTRAEQSAKAKAEREKADLAEQQAIGRLTYANAKVLHYIHLKEAIEIRINGSKEYIAPVLKVFDQFGPGNISKGGGNIVRMVQNHAQEMLKERLAERPVFARALDQMKENHYPPEADELKQLAYAAQKLDEEETATYWSRLAEATSQNKMEAVCALYKGYDQMDFSVKRRELLLKIEAATPLRKGISSGPSAPVSKPKPAISQTPSDEPAKPDTNRVAAMAKLANDYNQSISAINQLYPAINALESQLRTQRSFLTEENIVTIQFEINKANIALSGQIKKVRILATALDELNCKTIPNQPSTPPFQFIGKVE